MCEDAFLRHSISVGQQRISLTIFVINFLAVCNQRRLFYRCKTGLLEAYLLLIYNLYDIYSIIHKCLSRTAKVLDPWLPKCSFFSRLLLLQKRLMQKLKWFRCLRPSSHVSENCPYMESCCALLHADWTLDETCILAYVSLIRREYSRKSYDNVVFIKFVCRKKS